MRDGPSEAVVGDEMRGAGIDAVLRRRERECGDPRGSALSELDERAEDLLEGLSTALADDETPRLRVERARAPACCFQRRVEFGGIHRCALVEGARAPARGKDVEDRMVCGCDAGGHGGFGHWCVPSSLGSTVPAVPEAGLHPRPEKAHPPRHAASAPRGTVRHGDRTGTTVATCLRELLMNAL